MTLLRTRSWPNTSILPNKFSDITVWIDDARDVCVAGEGCGMLLDAASHHASRRSGMRQNTTHEYINNRVSRTSTKNTNPTSHPISRPLQPSPRSPSLTSPNPTLAFPFPFPIPPATAKLLLNPFSLPLPSTTPLSLNLL